MINGKQLVWMAGILAISFSTAGVCRAQGEAAGAPQAAPAGKLLQLLKAAEVQYFKIGKGGECYKVLLSYGTSDKVVAVILYEDELGDEALKVARLWALPVEVPEGFQPPAMLKKIATINNDFIIGKVGVDEKAGDVYYRSSFRLASATAEDLVNELQIAYYMHGAVRRALEPFVREQR